MNKLISGYNDEQQRLNNKNNNDKFSKADKLYQIKDDPIKSEPLIAGSFKIPESEYKTVSNIIRTLVNCDLNKVKQSEVFRMGLIALSNMKEEELVEIYKGLTKLKTGGKKSD